MSKKNGKPVNVTQQSRLKGIIKPQAPAEAPMVQVTPENAPLLTVKFLAQIHGELRNLNKHFEKLNG